MSVISLSVLRGVGGGEVSIKGSPLVNKGSTNVYEITDFDSFSVYRVETSVGTVSITGENITLEVPSVTSATNIVMTVFRDNEPKVYHIALENVGINTPVILSPANNSTNQSTSMTMTASEYSSAPVGEGELANSEWQVARDSGFTDIINSGVVDSGIKTAWHVGGLPINTTMFARVRYESTTLGMSSWSTPVKFTTLGTRIITPEIFSDEPTHNMKETPTFKSTPFETNPANSDSHLSSSWRLYKDGSGSPIWQINRSMTQKNLITIPKGILQVSTDYQIETRQEGSSVGESMWSDKLTFTSASSFIPEVGSPWEGGYFAGIINVDGTHYAIVLASAQAGGAAIGLSWKTTRTDTPNTNSSYNCKANMAGAVAAGINDHPAFKFCYEYRGGGFNDWLLPSPDVLEVIYRNLKPTTSENGLASSGGPHGATGTNPNSIPVGAPYTSTNPAQTPLALFKQGGAESFYGGSGWAWSSCQQSDTAAWHLGFLNGRQSTSGKSGGGSFYIRPIRLVRIN